MSVDHFKCIKSYTKQKQKKDAHQNIKMDKMFIMHNQKKQNTQKKRKVMK